jgi:methionyl-tRNA synthetase
MTDDNHRTHSLFLTTAIPYVNAAPHVGHALELLIGDALSRHYRQRGRDVHFTGGTDDHSLKNVRAAEVRGVSPSALVAEHGARFAALAGALGVKLDDYLHTSRDPRHAPAVAALWQRCAAAGDLYRKPYVGRYCTGCEAFVSDADLIDGCCPSHREPPEEVAETNWFFRLSRHQAALERALETGALRVEPAARQREVLAFVRSGLADFSVSRSRVRARGFGLSVPGDDEQVVYVWFDALTNYLSLLGFPEATPDFARYWETCGSEREHLIGKDVLRFHAVYWPAILLSAGLPLPSVIRVHGYVTHEGQKIGKSLGNAVDPFALVERYGEDAVRYYFLRHLHTTKDSDFRQERLRDAHDSELAGKLGNLVQRLTSLAERHPTLRLCAGTAVESDSDLELIRACQRATDEVQTACDAFALNDALAAVLELCGAINRYADAQEPWALSRLVRSAADEHAAADLLAQLEHVLWRACEALRITSILLWPFLPRAARAIARRLSQPLCELRRLERARFGAGSVLKLRPGPQLFPRLSHPGSVRGVVGARP